MVIYLLGLLPSQPGALNVQVRFASHVAVKKVSGELPTAQYPGTQLNTTGALKLYAVLLLPAWVIGVWSAPITGKLDGQLTAGVDENQENNITQKRLAVFTHAQRWHSSVTLYFLHVLFINTKILLEIEKEIVREVALGE